MTFLALILIPFNSAPAQDSSSGADAPSARPTPAEVREQSSSRDANTRVWENVYRTPILDPGTGQPTGQTTETLERYFEKGTNICYDSRENPSDPAVPAPQWQPTDIKIEPASAGDSAAEGYAYQVVRGPVKAYFKASPLAADANVRLAPRGQAPIDAQILGLVYYDPATGASRAVDSIRAVAPRVEGNRLIYPGAFACGSLEYIYTNLGVEQDVVIEHPEALPDPASVGFDPATAQLLVVSTIRPADPAAQAKILGPQDCGAGFQPAPEGTVDTGTTAVLSADLRTADFSDPAKSRIQGKNLTLQLTKCGVDASSAQSSSPQPMQIGEFAPGAAWDAAPNTSRTDLYKVIERADAASGNITLKEGISLAYLRAPERQFPVRIDWTYKPLSTMSVTRETWVKGLTYRISATYTIASGKTLTIEPGTIIKADGYNTTANYGISCIGTLICKGLPYDPIIFVPSGCTTVGADVGAGTWTYMAQSYLTLTSSSPTIEYCHFQGSRKAIVIQGNGLAARECGGSSSSGPQIQHCVFRGDYNANGSSDYGIYGDVGLTSGAEISVFNSLFVNHYYAGVYASIGLGFPIAQGGLIEVANCTFDGSSNANDYGIYCYWNSSRDSSHFFHIQNNVFSNVSQGIHWQNAGGGTNTSQDGYLLNNRCENNVTLKWGFDLDPNDVTESGTGTFDQTSLLGYLKVAGKQMWYIASNPAERGTLFSTSYANGNYYLAQFDSTGNNINRFIDKGRAFSDYTTGMTGSNINSTSLAALGASTIKRPLRIDDRTTADDDYFNINAGTESGVLNVVGTGNSESLNKFPDKENSDSESTDIGYHYPVVHAVLAPTTFIAGSMHLPLQIAPGTVIASIGSDSAISFQEGQYGKATLQAIGEPGKYIRFIDYAQAGDQCTVAPNLYSTGSPSATNKYLDIDVRQMNAEGIQIKYCIFERANAGVSISGVTNCDYYNQWPRAQISDCIFRHNGLWSSNDDASGLILSYCDGDVMNCLFDSNIKGIYVKNYGTTTNTTSYQPNVIGCTFNDGKYGVYVYPGYTIQGAGSTLVQDHTYATVEDCIFANMNQSGSTALYVYGSGMLTFETAHFTAIVRRNMFWNNATHVGTGDPNGAIDLTSLRVYDTSNGATNYPNSNSDDDVAAAPLFVNSSSYSPTTMDWKSDEDASRKFFLAQYNGNASREPLITGQITGITGAPTNITAYIYGNTETCGASYVVPCPDSPDLTNFAATYRKFPSAAHSTIGYTQLVLAASGNASASPSNVINITYRTRNSSSGPKSSIQCRLPNLSMTNGQFAQFWIAQDGSLYWAVTTKAVGNGLVAANVDCLSALHSSSDMLAQCWFTGTDTDKSPAINKGTPDYLSGGGTSTEFIRAGSTSYADNVLPKGYLEGYIRRTDYHWATNDDVSQDTELAKRLDLGFHYGGQQQINAHSNVSGVNGYVALAPSIRTLPRFPLTAVTEFYKSVGTTGLVPVNQTDPEWEPFERWHVGVDDYRRGNPMFTVLSDGEGNPGTDNSWKTGASVFCVKTSSIGNGTPPYYYMVDNIYALNVDTVTNTYDPTNGIGKWQMLYDPKTLVTSGYAIPTPTPALQAHIVSTNKITSVDAAAIPGVARLLAVRRNLAYSGDDYNVDSYVDLFKCASGATSWGKIGTCGIQNSRGSLLNGGLAMSVDTRAATPTAHIFWTQYSGANLVHYIHRATSNGASLTATGAVNINSNDLIDDLMLDSTDDHAGHTISATYDDITGSTQGYNRVTWPEKTSGGTQKVVAGRVKGFVDSFDRLNGELPNAASENHYVTSISSGRSYANSGTTSNPPSYLKSGRLPFGTAAASNGNYMQRWVCNTTGSNDSWTDSWTSMNPSETAESGRSKPAVAFRGLRLPRYAWTNAPYVDASGGVLNDGPVIVDSVKQLNCGDGIVLKTHSGNSIDQYMLGRYHWDNQGTTGTVQTITRMRP